MIYILEKDLGLNNPQELICHKIPTKFLEIFVDTINFELFLHRDTQYKNKSSVLKS